MTLWINKDRYQKLVDETANYKPRTTCNLKSDAKITWVLNDFLEIYINFLFYTCLFVVSKKFIWWIFTLKLINIHKMFAWNEHDIGNLSSWQRIQSYNYLICKESFKLIASSKQQVCLYSGNFRVKIQSTTNTTTLLWKTSCIWIKISLKIIVLV